MTYEILEYQSYNDVHKCIGEDGKIRIFDLHTDASFEGISDNPEYHNNYTSFMKSLVGKKFEMENETPYVPFYFVQGGKFIEP